MKINKYYINIKVDSIKRLARLAEIRKNKC